MSDDTAAIDGRIHTPQEAIQFLRESNAQLWDNDGAIEHRRVCTNPDDRGCRYLQAVEVLEAHLEAPAARRSDLASLIERELVALHARGYLGDRAPWHSVAELIAAAITEEAPAVAPPAITGETSDGYHTFNELYAYRKVYNALLFNEWAARGLYDVHKSWRHSDGEPCFGGGWFIVVAQTPAGQVSNHYETADWDLFRVPERERGAEYDGHTPQVALQRLMQTASSGPSSPRSPEGWHPIRWVKQDDPCGCALACLAMVTGQTYADVRAAWPDGFNFRTGGITHEDVTHYLGDRFIPYQLRYRFELGRNGVGLDGKDERVIRADWPQPFAPVHILGMGSGRHDVVLLADGTVLDPMQEAPRHLRDIGEVAFMIGVWPQLRLAQTQNEFAFPPASGSRVAPPGETPKVDVLDLPGSTT
jgi:hypothetical protein